MSSEVSLTDARAVLESERAQLQRQLEAITSAEHDPNFADSGQVAAEVGETRTLAGSIEEQLNAVEAALARIDAGTYGICVSCKSPIAPARLEALPATPYCVTCASRA